MALVGTAAGLISRMSPSTGDSRSQGSPSLPGFVAATSLQARQPSSRRAHYRKPAEACRPIGLQLLAGPGQPGSRWQQADILDLSLGGLCVLVTEGENPLPLEQLQQLRLDLRLHPSFGVEQMAGEVRWFVRSGLVLTMGIGFKTTLASLPRLTPYRRQRTRPTLQQPEIRAA